jgi:hypothetical protein
VNDSTVVALDTMSGRVTALSPGDAEINFAGSAERPTWADDRRMLPGAATARTAGRFAVPAAESTRPA